MTQPPLTQAIAQLERLLGVRLLDRTKRSVALTATASAVARGAGVAGPCAGAFEHRAAAAGELGRLRLAFVSTGFALPSAVVARRWALYPRHAWKGPRPTVTRSCRRLQVRTDRFYAVRTGFAPAGLARTSSRRSRYAALPEQHPLAAAQVLTLDAVAGTAGDLPRRIVPSLFDAIFALYHAAGHSPQVAQEVIQDGTIVNLVSAGLGWPVPGKCVAETQRPGVVYWRWQGAGGKGLVVPGCETEAWCGEGSLSPSLERFIGFVRETP